MSSAAPVHLVEVNNPDTPQPPSRRAQDQTARAEESASLAKDPTKRATTAIIATISGVTTISSLLSGVVTICLPVVAKDLAIPYALLFWPMSIYSLTCGCTLILCGALADVVGSRNMYILGAFFQSIFTMACGLSRTSTQLIVFRAFAGIAISFCLPSAVSLIMTYFPAGRRRNIAFAAMGGGQPLGFTIGLVMGGRLTDSVGWQLGFYLAAGINTLLFFLALFGLPKITRQAPLRLTRLKNEVDWIGATILSSSLALLLYVLATWTGNLQKIKSAESISCLVIGTILLPTFAIWCHRQERMGNKVLIRNSIWRNKAFVGMCMNVFLFWGALNTAETFIAFFFQDVQGLSATASSVRFLPEPVLGALITILIGLYVHRLRVDWALYVAFAASAISPVLLAVMRKEASYWEFEFSAIALLPIACDVLWTVSQLVITAEFDENTQALAGGVFNTVAQIGKSVGLAISAVVASSISMKAGDNVAGSDRLLEGYRAAWWFTFAEIAVCVFVTFWGLRNIGKVGVKQE